MNLALINAQNNPPANPPAKPVLTATQDGSGRAKVVWPECIGAHHYIVKEGTASGVYTKETIIDAAAGKCEHTTGVYADETVVYFTVSSVGVNGVESADATEANATIDTTVKLAATFDLTAPAAGVNAAGATVDAGADYTVAATAWKDETEAALAIGQPFVAGKTYTATVTLQTKEGYTFAEDCEVTAPEEPANVTATLNEAKTELSIVCTYAALPA